MGRIAVTVCCTIVASLSLTASSVWAAGVEFSYTGTVRAIDASFASALPAGSGIVVGAPIWIVYSFESTTPDADPSITLGNYPGTIQSWTLDVGDYAFAHAAGGAVNEITVLFGGFSTIYQATDSVVATPSIPGQSSLVSDVFFVGLSPLGSDALPTTPPDPTDPDWGQSDAGLFDGGGTTLIDIDLTALCSAPCGPPASGKPVPTSGTLWLFVLLLSAGVWAASSGAIRTSSDADVSL